MQVRYLLVAVVIEYRLTFADLRRLMPLRQLLKEMIEHVALPITRCLCRWQLPAYG